MDEPVNFEEECLILLSELKVWKDRAFKAEEMLARERAYIEDIYKARDAGL